MRPIWAVGLMSGTSLDGVDAAAVCTDGIDIEALGPGAARDYAPAEAAALRAALEAAAGHWQPERGMAPEAGQAFAAAEAVLGESHAEAVGTCRAALAQEHGARAALVGFHGQTVLHRPEAGYTLQIGDARALACDPRVRLPVVSDFRSADVAAGGEGAPLAPFFHFALSRSIGADKPLVFLNLGGVGNVTWVDPTAADAAAEGALLAFDTGPANALVNDWMWRRTGVALDRDGAAAAAGRVHPERLASNAARAYLDRVPPKSLDRNDFAAVLAGMEGLSTADGAATLTAFSADCVAEAARHFPAPPERWLVCGGGRRNPVMMRMLAERLEAPVLPVEAVGLDGDLLEAQAFAYLAVRVLRGLPTSAPGTTGVAAPVCGGRVSLPDGPEPDA
ncbi:anhydro-N-acetylmuramic acid kinase [Oceanicella sp. SM1341]|uniref:anhydro-N-acetylmuramic acid kinase n=1 Tax=Oceanicella sp. SM1341 TaxID=1548889 RepID=UPI000E520626|nr:anhydro-N-acetylmuramic acid kinase [Oceanicella sp. SM1341]